MNIIDTYKLLFGRKGIEDGSVIDMAEHGRTGGISTGTPFKSVQNVPNLFLIDEDSTTVTYLGEAAPGTTTSAAKWRIRKISESGTVTTLSFAGGEDRFNQVWDNRASLTYS